ncbi:MAG: enoyl-CoA hydratase/isomerase family protein [Pseudooceanicola sp.]|nr:enoyl-CoA hydratase/isomerase family protein [Pseudooceanicola sp.]
MTDISIRVTGSAGRITFTRPKALNAMTYEMCMAIDAAMRAWMDDARVKVVVIDAEGDKAFCAGGDIAELYATGRAGDFTYGRRFWRDEYRVNAMIYGYPKPVVSFMQGFVMGGGVGIGCHAGFRVVDESSRIAMPECGIGLVPDVGGTLILAKAPGKIGEFVGLTAHRLMPDDAMIADFADDLIAHAEWPSLIERLETGDDVSVVAGRAGTNAAAVLADHRAQIDRHFSQPSLPAILESLAADDSDFARETLAALKRNSPLSMACTLEILRRLREEGPTIQSALTLEYRYTWRSMEHGDFLEGIRAQIIDKDRNPRWQYADGQVPQAAIDAMLAPLGEDELTFE